MFLRNGRRGNEWTQPSTSVAIDAMEFDPIVIALAAKPIHASLPPPPSFALVRQRQMVMSESIERSCHNFQLAIERATSLIGQNPSP
jgi:hypothetical protein